MTVAETLIHVAIPTTPVVLPRNQHLIIALAWFQEARKILVVIISTPAATMTTDAVTSIVMMITRVRSIPAWTAVASIHAQVIAVRAAARIKFVTTAGVPPATAHST